MKNRVSCIMLFSMSANAFLALIKIIFGIMFSSVALISDGIHSLSDLFTDVVALIGNHLALKPADKEHPYGHGKIEYLTSLIIGVIIIIVGLEVVINSFNKDIIIPSSVVILVSFVTIIIKLLLSNYLIRQGKKRKNNILVASGLESRMDVLSSIIVMISLILIQFSKTIEIFKYCDILASIIIAIFIILSGIKIIKENVSIVLGEQETDEEYIEKVSDIIKNVDGVLGIESLVLMKYGHKYNLNLIVNMDGDITITESHIIADNIENNIKKEYDKIEYINIHIEPYNEVDNI